MHDVLDAELVGIDHDRGMAKNSCVHRRRNAGQGQVIAGHFGDRTRPITRHLTSSMTPSVSYWTPVAPVVIKARIIHEEADYSRKTNAPVWYKGCAHRPFATTEALA